MLILIILGAFTAFYWYMTRNFGFFRKHGIPEVPSSFPFGCQEANEMMTGRRSFINPTDTIYQQYKHLPMVGAIFMGRPVLVINDLDLAKRILIKDFEHFMDRRHVPLSEEVEGNKYLMNMLTFVEGDKWKYLRHLLSPVFTSGKLKAMTAIMTKVGQDFTNELNHLAAERKEFLVKETMVNFMLDSIAGCGFGLEVKAQVEKQSKFKQMVIKLSGGGGSQQSAMAMARAVFVFSFPDLAKKFNLPLFDPEANSFFVDVIRQTLTQRKESKIKKNDFIDLVLSALKNELNFETENDQFEKDATVANAKKLSITEQELEFYLVANLFIFFAAGFDTSSSIMTLASYYLAIHPEIQDRLHEEIMETLSDEDMTDLGYDKAHSLPYLDQVIHETLRKYPLLFLERVCTKPYKVPGTNFTMPVGMTVNIPNFGIMSDPKYYSDADGFNPDHFSPEQKANRNPYAFLAFGQGPRNCIGMRFALMSVKVGMIRFIRDFKVLPSEKTPKKIEIDPWSQSGQPKGGVWLRVEKR